jgi:16S rRNA processing protein RimM
VPRVVVGRIGKAHGVRGLVTVEVRTDDPERRFAPGSQLLVEGEPDRTIRVADARWHAGRLLLEVDGVSGREEAEALRGLVLEVDVPDDETPDDPDEYYDRQLVGLRVVDVAGADIGAVREVVHLPSQDLLVVERGDGGEAMVPFVEAIVTSVDLGSGVVTIDPPLGLLDGGS